MPNGTDCRHRTVGSSATVVASSRRVRNLDRTTCDGLIHGAWKTSRLPYPNPWRPDGNMYTRIQALVPEQIAPEGRRRGQNDERQSNGCHPTDGPEIGARFLRPSRASRFC